MFIIKNPLANQNNFVNKAITENDIPIPHEEILKFTTWINNEEAVLECFSPLIEKNVKIKIYTNEKHKISNRSIDIVNQFIRLSPPELCTIKKFLWEDCQFCCANISWGVYVPEGKSETEANHEDLGVFNEQDALEKSSLKVTIYESDEECYTDNYGYLCFDNSWNSHLTTIIMKNGKIVGYGDSGVDVEKFN